MGNILISIQHFFVVVFTAVITTVTIALPFHKPLVHPTPTPKQEVQVKKESTPSAKVLGVSQEDNKIQQRSPRPVVSIQTSPPIQTPTPSPSVTPTPAPVPPSNSATIPYTPPQQNVVTVPTSKPDYSSYKISLGYTLSSLNSRLNSIRNNADNLPAQVQAAKDAVNAKLQSDLGTLENNYNSTIRATTSSLGVRGLGPGSSAWDQTLQSITSNYNAQKQALINQANQDISQATNNGVNLVYQANAQDIDLSNKIKVVQGLIDKINSGSFTDSDIPLAIQATSY